jgi:hypothetical protein
LSIENNGSVTNYVKQRDIERKPLPDSDRLNRSRVWLAKYMARRERKLFIKRFGYEPPTEETTSEGESNSESVVADNDPPRQGDEGGTGEGSADGAGAEAAPGGTQGEVYDAKEGDG